MILWSKITNMKSIIQIDNPALRNEIRKSAIAKN